MSIESKVIWTEGMFLRPQHFQQQDRYLDSKQKVLLEASSTYFWGFSQLEIDQNALKENKLSILKASGIFKDGTAFSLGPNEVPMLPLDTLTREETIYLVLPSREASRQEVSYDEGSDLLARFSVVETTLSDVSDITLGEAPVQIGKPKFRFMPDSEIDGSWIKLPLVHYKGKNKLNIVEVDSGFIQPTLNCTFVDNPITNHLSKVVELLNLRSTELSKRFNPNNRTSASTTYETIILGIVNRNLFLFRHLYTLEYLHPEVFFRYLSMLVAELAMFHPDSIAINKIPSYDHDALKVPLENLMSQIGDALNIVFEDAYVSIPLEDKGHGLSVGKVPDKSLFAKSQFVLAVKADLPGESVRKTFPQQAKLGPTNRMRDLVHLQLPGITLEHMDQVPAALPYHAGYIYFNLVKDGDMWNQFEKSSTLALHLAGEYPGLDMLFWAVKNTDKRNSK